MDARMTAGFTSMGSVLVVGFMLLFPGMRPSWVRFGGYGRYAAIQRAYSSSDSDYEWYSDPNTPGMRVGVLTRKASSPKPVRNSPALTKAEAALEKGAWHLEREEWQDAIKQFVEALRLEPKNADALFSRGAARYCDKQLNEALADFDAVLRLRPKDVDALIARATIRIEQEQPRMAVADLDAALGIDPENVEAYCSRGKMRENEGEYKLALYDYQNAIRRASDDVTALNCLAWLLATAPDDSLRDGKRAVEAAVRAVQLENAKEWDTIDTLAAAFAETGKFAEAVRSQKEALRLAPDEEHDDIKSRLELYQASKPYRMTGSKE